MPQNPNLIVLLVNFLSQVMNRTSNTKTTQNFYSIRALSFVFIKKKKRRKENIQEDLLGKKKTLFLFFKKKIKIKKRHSLSLFLI